MKLKKGKSDMVRNILRQFINIMVLILIIAGGISIFAKEYVDAALILGIVI